MVVADLEDLIGLGTRRYVSPYDIGLTHLGLGDGDSALTWLERAHAERDHQMTFLLVDPRLDPLRSSPRFARLVQVMGFVRAARSGP